MERMLTVDDVAETLQISRRSAYRYMAGMVHLEKPMRITEGALREWISRGTVDPDAPRRPRVTARRHTGPDTFRIPKRQTKGGGRNA